MQDVNTQLMDDNYVSSDKIGTGNYFWAFPGSQGAQAKKQLDEVRCAGPSRSRCWRRVDGVEGSHHAIKANSHRASREPHRPRRTWRAQEEGRAGGQVEGRTRTARAPRSSRSLLI